jgi:hypothetical protein
MILSCSISTLNKLVIRYLQGRISYSTILKNNVTYPISNFKLKFDFSFFLQQDWTIFDKAEMLANQTQIL